jgi:Uma2 family endonuclease
MNPSQRRPFTAAEFWKMYELGFFADQRVELIGGEIVAMAAETNWHAVGVSLTQHALEQVFDPLHYWVRNQAPLDLSPLSVPDPDIAVVVGSMRTWAPSCLDCPQRHRLCHPVRSAHRPHPRRRPAADVSPLGSVSPDQKIREFSCLWC